MPESLLRIPEVAARLNISRARAYELVRTGRIPAVRITPRQIRVDPTRLEAWISSGGGHLNNTDGSETDARH
jgi:excisionase family DNA binding protein